MPDIVARLKQEQQKEETDQTLLEDALQEITGLRERRDALEEILIILARTSLPWDEEGRPGESFPAFRERYQRVMHEAVELLGLERSMLTRTEPKT
jgi:hypothetical protein